MRVKRWKSAELIIKQGGGCAGISCRECCMDDYCCFTTKDGDKLEQAKKYKKEHEMKFKVGDKVKWNGSEDTACMDEERKSILRSKGEHIISHIDDSDNTCLLVESPFWFKLEWFNKVESNMGLIKGKRYEVSNDEDFSNKCERMFYLEEKGFEYPYYAITDGYENKYKNKDCVILTPWKYIREIQPKYKPYEKLDVDWLGKKVIFKLESNISECSKITGFHIYNNSFRVDFDTKMSRSLKQCFEDIEWIDEEGNRTPFGEEIK